MTSNPIPDYVRDHFAAHPGRCRPMIRMADGHTLSVQASAGHYCTPKVDNSEAYTSVEVFGWSTARTPSTFAQYTRSQHEPAAFVPIDKVNRFIHRHGGL